MTAPFEKFTVRASDTRWLTFIVTTNGSRSSDAKQRKFIESAIREALAKAKEKL